MQIKVCGLREPDNIAEISLLGIDYMGFIFYEKSSRNFDVFASIPSFPNIKKVGVFVNSEIDFVLQMFEEKKIDYLQLHGQENVAYCEQLKKAGAGIIKVFSVGEDFDFEQTKPYASVCDYFLFDTKGKRPGGNGIVFNWQLLTHYDADVPFFLSGGIGPESVSAIKALHLEKLHAIDVNSKFEMKPARKDVGQLKKFIHELRN